MAKFGKDIMLREFMLDSSKIFVNQGAYGNAPKKVIDCRIRLIQKVEEQPDEWFRWQMEGKWMETVRNVSNFVGSDPENLVFVSNTTAGVNTVVRSLPFEKGDGILLTSWTYGAVKNTCTYIADTRNVELLYVDIPFPLVSVAQLLDAYEEKLSKHTNIKFVIVDYISSVPPTLMPLKKLIALCRKYDKLVFVDGAHTPGQLSLNLEQLGADFYTGNLHKWGFAPRGSAILWISPKFHNKIFPVVTSQYNKEMIHKNFFYLGTADYSTYYCSDEAIKFYKDIGGHEKISEYCTKLVTQAADLLVKKWGTCHFPVPDEMLAPFMRIVRLPDFSSFLPHSMATEDYRNMIRDNNSLMELVWERFQIQSVFVSLYNQLWCRISASVYNVIEDYEKLADAILSLQKEDKENN